MAQNAGLAPDLLSGMASPTIRYSLIGDGTNSGLAEAPVGQPDANGNLIGGPSYGTIDPQLGPLLDNGGSTLTRAVLATSPVVDAGNPAFFSPPDFDQRGAPYLRLFGDRVDMGAFELQLSPIVVDTVADEDDGDLGPGDLSLREAIGLASSRGDGATIFFDTQTFATSQTITLTMGELAITDSLTIFGPGTDLLTIDADHASRVFHIDDGSMGSVLQVALSGMTLQHGQAPLGGAILSREDLNLAAVTIRDNTASADGGGVAQAYGDLTITTAQITGNTAAGSGGGIAQSEAGLTLADSWVTDNASHQGGGVSIGGGELIVMRTSVSANSADAGGGGISMDAGTAEISASTISGNSSQSGATAGGGGISIYSGSMVISNSTISGNAETRLAGGESVGGGGIGNTSGVLTIRHSTIADNRVSSASGGSPATGGGLAGPATLDHTLVADNFADDGGHDIAGEITARYSLIEDPEGGTILDQGGLVIGFDPELGPLQDNGGPTLTHALLGRRAYNAGDPNAIAGMGDVPLKDQRGQGFDRIKAGRIDIGAFESDPLPPLGCDFDLNDLCDIDDLDALIMEIATRGNDPRYDLTGEGVVNNGDRNQWLVEAGALNLPSGERLSLG